MKCAVGNCKQSNSIKTTVSFYSFPRDESQRKLWVKFCNRVKPVNVEREKICALHFKQEDFERNFTYEMGFSKRSAKKLKPHAVPSIENIVIDGEKKIAYGTEEDETKKPTNNQISLEVKCVKAELPTDIEEDGVQNDTKTLELKIDSLLKENRSLKMAKILCDVTIKNLSGRIQKLSFAYSNLEKALRRLFTEGQIKKLKSGDKRQNFTETDIAQSITLYYASARAYRLLRKKHFPLPSVRTLQRWSQKLDVSKGRVQNPKKRKRMGWNEGSEIALLELWPERLEELRGQRKNGHVYAEMADDLSRLGYSYSPRDVQVKLQNFTQRYRKERAAMGVPAAPLSTWVHYARIHQIIGGFKPNLFTEMGLESTDVTGSTGDDTNLDELLENFNLIDVKPFLTRAEITFESLKYLSKEDIKEAIPPIGLRACFREKLFSWRKTEYTVDDETLSESIANKVVHWLQNPSNIGTTSRPTSTFSTSAGISKLSKSLKHILDESLKGKSITAYYEKNGHLTDSLRADLINIILEDIFYHDAKLSPKDFPILVEEIVENFSSEIREYYFIPRGKKANPGGKLWDKYVNQRAKRARLDKFFKDDLEPADSTAVKSEIDETVLQELKSSLSGDISNWDNVRDIWSKTFLLRQKELKFTKNIFEFITNWKLYSNTRFDELINIDFQLMYPNKSNLLFTKWNEFMQKIGNYYYLHIKDKKSKEILTYSRDISNQNSLDYIHIILLNSVILPTARFSDKFGKNSKKVTIPDANDSFIIHLTEIDDYEKVIYKVKEQYYSNDLTVQPFIIVVGSSIYDLEDFYVYFDKTLLKCDCFLKTIDVCFKIIQTLFLEYPKGCQGPWQFIQEYFYEIKPANDIKLSNIYSLLNFLKFQ